VSLAFSPELRPVHAQTARNSSPRPLRGTLRAPTTLEKHPQCQQCRYRRMTSYTSHRASFPVPIDVEPVKIEIPRRVILIMTPTLTLTLKLLREPQCDPGVHPPPYHSNFGHNRDRVKKTVSFGWRYDGLQQQRDAGSHVCGGRLQQ
jgi:hypothetical protein